MAVIEEDQQEQQQQQVPDVTRAGVEKRIREVLASEEISKER